MYVVLADVLTNLGILVFMNRDTVAGTGPGGGGKKKSNAFLQSAEEM